MSEEINHDGTVVVDAPQLATNIDLLITQALHQNNWIVNQTLTDGSLRNFDITNVIGETFHLRVFLGKVRVDATRPANEKKIQLGSKDPRILKATDTADSKTYILGVYVRNSNDSLNDSIFAAWDILESVNYPGNVSIRLKSELLQKAKIKGFAQMLNDAGTLICAFRPEFIHYYLMNSEFLHGKSEIHEVVELNSMQNKIYYGAPGTGKSYKVEEILKGVPNDKKERITFHPEYDNASFVGGYKPISEGDEIKYKFVPQVFTNIYVRAWKDLDNPYYLAIEEINRGNCAEIFGDIFQLLDRNSNYTVSPSEELKKYLIEKFSEDGGAGEDHEGIKNGMKLPPNLHLLATMNTSDQSLFPMDSAFKRRWDWEYVPINYDELNEDGSENKSLAYIVKVDDTLSFKWIDFIKAVNSIIKNNPNLGMDKCIGNYFIKPSENEISIEEFINKAIFYLWNDVFKDEDKDKSIFKGDTTYEDFFPIKSKGIEKVKNILAELEIETKNTAAVQPENEDENPD
jgi:hypothetical protein